MKIICAADIPRAILREGCTAVVHSVYKHTVNLMAGETLISLQGNDLAMTPMALRTDLAGDTLQNLFEVGDTVKLSADGVQAGDIVIPMPSCACSYSGRLSGAFPPDKAAFISLLERCLAVFAKDSVFSGPPFENAVTEAAAHTATEIIGRAKADPMVLQELLGLGIGLTPSGDDFIIGVLAALELYKKSDIRTRLAEAVGSNLSATNTISAAFLRHAINGRYSERLLEMLLHPSEGRVVLAASVGHSSGADTLFGILFTSNTLSKEQRPWLFTRKFEKESTLTR